MQEKIGVQLYTVRDYLNSETQIAQTFQKLRAIGYDNIQTHGPLSGISYEKFGELAREAGLEICGSFDDFEQMKYAPAAAIEKHRALNTTIMGIACAGVFRNGTLGFYSEKDVEDAISGMVLAAQNIAPAGFKFAYHNHGHEFCKLGKKTILQHFIEQTPADTVSFCLDTYWTQYGGGNILKYIRMLKNRLDILHLKDFGRTPSAPYTAAIGDGNLCWEEIIEEARCAGVRYYVVEQDDCQGEDPFDALARSREYLDKL